MTIIATHGDYRFLKPHPPSTDVYAFKSSQPNTQYKVDLPPHFYPFWDIVRRVRAAVKNFLLCPAIEGNLLRFVSTNLTRQRWKVVALIPHSEGSLGIWIPRSDGTVTYRCGKSLIKWDWKHDRRAVTTFPNDISAIAELPSGIVVVGDDKGNVFFDSPNDPLAVGEKVRKIVPLSDDLVLVKTTKYFLCSRNAVVQDLSDYNDIVVVLGQKLIGHKGEKPYVLHMEETRLVHEQIHDKPCGRIEAVINHPEEVVLFHKDHRIAYVYHAGNKTVQPFGVGHIERNGSEFYRVGNELRYRYPGFGIDRVTENKSQIYKSFPNNVGAAYLHDNTVVISEFDSKTNTSNIKTDEGAQLLELATDIANRSINKIVQLPDGSLCVEHFNYDKSALAILQPDSSPPLSPREHRSTLEIGAGNFSYTLARVNKYRERRPWLASTITATEYGKEHRAFNSAICLKLLQKGVDLVFDVDAQTIHEKFRGKRFKRIQWNCPFGKGDSEEDKRAFKLVFFNFFHSAAQLQYVNDRIHIVLMQEEPTYKIDRQKQNWLVHSTASSGYRLVKKRRFGTDRYPGYQHLTTSGNPHNQGKMKEFIFEKTGLNPDESPDLAFANQLKSGGTKSYTILNGQPELKDAYFDCSSDEESSGSEEV